MLTGGMQSAKRLFGNGSSQILPFAPIPIKAFRKLANLFFSSNKAFPYWTTPLTCPQDDPCGGSKSASIKPTICCETRTPMIINRYPSN